MHKLMRGLVEMKSISKLNVAGTVGGEVCGKVRDL